MYSDQTPPPPHRPIRQYYRSGIVVAFAGFSLLEVLIATALSTILLIGASNLFDYNRVTVVRNRWRFAAEDDLRFAINRIDEKISLTGHAYCGDLGNSYTYNLGVVTNNANYTNNAGVGSPLYPPAGSTGVSTLVAYQGGALAPPGGTASWYPNLPASWAGGFETDINPDFDALVVRGLGKYHYSLLPGPTLGGAMCTAPGSPCIFTTFIGNPLLNPNLSINTDEMFYDVSYPSPVLASGLASYPFPMALTDCNNYYEIVGVNYTPNPPVGVIVRGDSNFFTLPGVAAWGLPINDPTGNIIAQAAHNDLIFVSDQGVLSMSRIGSMPLAPGALGVYAEELTLPPAAPPAPGDITITGFRILYGTVNAAGSPTNFLRPNDVVNWNQVKVVRYAIMYEIVDYFNVAVTHPATNLLDINIATVNSANFRRIYESTVHIQN